MGLNPFVQMAFGCAPLYIRLAAFVSAVNASWWQLVCQRRLRTADTSASVHPPSIHRHRRNNVVTVICSHHAEPASFIVTRSYAWDLLSFCKSRHCCSRVTCRLPAFTKAVAHQDSSNKSCIVAFTHRRSATWLPATFVRTQQSRIPRSKVQGNFVERFPHHQRMHGYCQYVQICWPVVHEGVQSVVHVMNHIDMIGLVTALEVSLHSLTLFVNNTGWWNGVPSIPC